MTGRVRFRLGFVVALAASGAAIVEASPVSAAQGDIHLFAGNYSMGSGGNGGPATSAQLGGPTGVAVADDGRVFIADRFNNQIRVVALDGTISTLVSGLFNPVDVAVDDAAGLLYFTEDAFQISRLSRVDISGPGPYSAVVIAGVGSGGYAGDGGPANLATFNSIAGIGIGPDGDVYIADRQNNRIRRIDVATGDIDLVAGTGAGGGDNGDALTEATFAGPKDVAVAADGTVYVADEGTNLIRAIAGGQVSVYAGNYSSGSGGDDGPATDAQLNSPDGVAVAPNGDVYIADTNNNKVRKVDTVTHVITTVAGTGGCCVTGDDGPATSALVGNPIRVDIDSLGAIFIASEPENAIRVVEGAPIVADAGGPYTIAEGDSLVLDGSGTVAGPTAAYAWDLDGDDAFDDAFGVSPTVAQGALQALGLADGPHGPVTVSLHVTESVTIDTADATVTVVNVAPIATLDVPDSVVAGTPVTIEIGALDPGPVDAAAQFTYHIDWGDGTAVSTITGPADPPATHTYAAAGSVSLSVTATDKDGGVSEATVEQVAVQAAPTTTSTTTTPTTTTPTTTTPATTTSTIATPTTVSPVLPPTGQSTESQTLIAALLVIAGTALLVWRARRA